MALTITSDYKGQYKIPSNCYTELATYIAKYESIYLLDLLGAELYNLFIADLDGSTPQVPQDARFLALYNAFNIDESVCIVSSEGIKKMLIQFIYFEYMRDSSFTQTVSGVTNVSSSVATLEPYKGWNLEQAFNEGVGNYNAIQWYICDNSTVYPEENSQHKSIISIL